MILALINTAMFFYFRYSICKSFILFIINCISSVYIKPLPPQTPLLVPLILQIRISLLSAQDLGLRVLYTVLLQVMLI